MYKFFPPSTYSQMFWEGLSIISCLKERKFTNKMPNFTCSTGSCNFLNYLLSLKDLLVLKDQIALEIVLLPIQKCQFISSLIFTGQSTKWGGQERSVSGWRLALRGGNITEKKIRKRVCHKRNNREEDVLRVRSRKIIRKSLKLVISYTF